IKRERKLKKGGARCKHRPPPKMTHQQDLTKSHFFTLCCISIVNSPDTKKDAPKDALELNITRDA
ncbi:hypothetical protein, partial [Limosilactobacillus fermentum]|uniref:hypothetical protein n=1 Tax=Limosilactobacillus fermentum TaxID=1613 RepID=UPI0005560E60